MLEREPKPPIGEAKKLTEIVSKGWQEHLLLFSRVKNEVLEVNPAFQRTLPLALEEGRPSPLGLFIEAAFERKLEQLPKEKQALEFWPQHHRSIILGRVIFKDNDGHIYRDIDLKGIGRHPLSRFGSGLGEKMAGSGRIGLLEEDMAEFDYQMTEEFLMAGIRTCRIIGIIKLKEIISMGRKLSLREAEETGIIDKDFHPVVEVRAYATKFRIDDILAEVSIKNQNAMIEDAQKIISREFGIKEFESNYDYLKWFAETLGRNVGLIHKNGWLHDYLTGHNITLDCRIIDLDSLSRLTNEEERLSEVRIAMSAFSLLFKELKELKFSEDRGGGMEYLEELFNENYDAAFPQEERLEYYEKLKK